MKNYKLDNINIDDFKSMYNVMEKSFPSIERRNYEDQKKLFHNKYYNVIGYKDEEDNVCAFLAFWKLKNFNFIEHFAVDDILRGNGIGTKLLKAYLNNNNKMTVLEVEMPDNDIAERRIQYYKRMGMKLNDYDYVQPPLQEGSPLLPLKIMSYGREIIHDEFLEVRDKIYKKVYEYSI
ncbi:GNAT family N-acetyltransferase [uncultured Clostridium sp.]|uniref:GNAT family N-acetyltransferase n=1 Tax=uncultured Clostridium sp. TaxID=59620 RepID=UPI0025FB7DE1|nr:GNAT family N-acetyltransferase [uncultured Clostridium sp.]